MVRNPTLSCRTEQEQVKPSLERCSTGCATAHRSQYTTRDSLLGTPFALHPSIVFAKRRWQGKTR